ncbi:MAG TPA: hypothetical protein VLH08_06810 [Acidobacteriota bacterium]|nr:hypothetical protein [Acidobacteriota bacterium]
MYEAIQTYFAGEKNAALVILGIGLLGLIAAFIFFQPRFALRSFAITLAIFAFIEIAIGVGLFVRTGPQVKGLIAEFEKNTSAYVSSESERMIRVQKNFVIIQYVELFFILLTAILAITFKKRISISGIALAFLVNAAILLAFDIVAERRGERYLTEIQTSSNYSR